MTMHTKRFWNPYIGGGAVSAPRAYPASAVAAVPDRRAVGRRSVDFYAVELADGCRYLRQIRNVSERGLMLEDRLTFQRPGEIVELELPRHHDYPLRVRAEVVRVTASGQVGLRTIGGPWMDGLGGHIEL